MVSVVGVADVEDVAIGVWSLGADIREVGAGLCCSRPGTSPEGLTNFVCRLRPGSVDDLEATVEALRRWCRRVVLDAATPSWVEAELVARDWRLGHQLQLVLPAEHALTHDTAAATLRALELDDWPVVYELLLIDHAEEDHRAGRAPRERRHTDDALVTRRGIAEHADYLVATAGGVPVGFCCGWSGPQRLGIVEDVFVHPDHRHRGIASALITSAVAAARSNGATDICLAADPDDTPKQLYRRMGFAPLAVTRTLTSPT